MEACGGRCHKARHVLSYNESGKTGSAWNYRDKNRDAPLWLLKKMYRPEVYYQKAGVMLSELVPEEGQQINLFAYSSSCNKSGKLMDTLDQINRKYRRSTIHLASEGVGRTWSMCRSFKSPNYTGDWNELPVVS